MKVQSYLEIVLKQSLSDLQLAVIHVCEGGMQLGVVGRVQQLDDQVPGQQLGHKRMLEEQKKHMSQPLTCSIRLSEVQLRPLDKVMAQKQVCPQSLAL